MIEELTLSVKKADERTKQVNLNVIAKDKELETLKDNMTKEICANEMKAKAIEKLKNVITKKSDEIKKLKEDNSKSDNNKSDDDVVKLTQKLEETRDLCLEYKNKVETLKKENRVEVNKIKTEKMKVEDELRTVY